ncbi:hypothetical protein NDU88_001628 [Pleurodeles waltl]|uniref:Uncharacterized protein n=1 Tax=Pleurodeles waltl TaxID=8319 RepID=A0AAV7MLH0_PLEWA|nr:hypothetical protein NDU88_001628 [Pleurodeles waltl]
MKFRPEECRQEAHLVLLSAPLVLQGPVRDLFYRHFWAAGSRPCRGLKHPKWRPSIVRSSDQAVFRAGGGACFKLRGSRVWDKTLGRTTGVQWVPTRGKGAARAGALRRSTGLSRAVCGRSQPALRAPGSPPAGQRSVPAHTTGSRHRPLTSVVMPGSKRQLRFAEHAAPISWAARSSRRARVIEMHFSTGAQRLRSRGLG